MIRFKEGTPLSERYAPAMKIVDRDEAVEYLEALIEYNMRVWGSTREHAEETERRNLGYYAGYYNWKVMAQVEAVFGACHPVFSSAEESQVAVNV